MTGTLASILEEGGKGKGERKCGGLRSEENDQEDEYEPYTTQELTAAQPIPLGSEAGTACGCGGVLSF